MIMMIRGIKSSLLKLILAHISLHIIILKYLVFKSFLLLEQNFNSIFLIYVSLV
jgi:hypothetical protein